MTRPALLLPLVLSIALVACGTSAPKSAQERQREATQAVEMQAPQNTQETTAQATPEPPALPTVDPIIAQMAADNKALLERVQVAENKIDEQTLSITQAQERTAASNAQAAKYNDAQRAKDVDIAREVTAQKQADADNNAALAELEKARAQSSNAANKSLLMMFVTVLFFIFGLLLLRMMRRYQVAPIIADNDPELDREQWHAPEPGQGVGADLVSIPIDVATGKQLRALANGLGAKMPFTHASFTPLENGFSEGGWRKFVNHCLDNNLAKKDKPDLDNSPITPSDRLLNYIMPYRTTTTHPRRTPTIIDAAVLPDDRQTDTSVDTGSGAGEGLEDHFGILEGEK